MRHFPTAARMPIALERLEGRAGVPHRLHVEDGGSAAEQELRGAEHGGPVDGLLGVGGLEWPDPAHQPVLEPQIVGEPAEQRLTEMDVAWMRPG